MSRIRSRDNKDTEQALAKLLRQHGIKGWRRHQPYFGKPDFIFPKIRLAVFVDGCFWHDCPKHAKKPKNNRAFWLRKLAVNRRRDIRVNRVLRKQGWRVLRIWEHELTSNNELHLLQRVQAAITTKQPCGSSSGLPGGQGAHKMHLIGVAK